MIKGLMLAGLALLASALPALADADSTRGVVVTGQAKIAVTGTAVQFSANLLQNSAVIKSKTGNNATCAAVGGPTINNTVDGTGNGYIICPGEAAGFITNNTANLWVNGTVGDIFTLEGN